MRNSRCAMVVLAMGLLGCGGGSASEQPSEAFQIPGGNEEPGENQSETEEENTVEERSSIIEQLEDNGGNQSNFLQPSEDTTDGIESEGDVAGATTQVADIASEDDVVSGKSDEKDASSPIDALDNCPKPVAESEQCNPYCQLGCEEDEHCTTPTEPGAYSCMAYGSSGQGEPCSGSDDCAPGLACFQLTGEEEAICRAFCIEDSSCPGDAKCNLSVNFGSTASTFCGPYNPWCLEFGSECTIDEACCSGFCVEGKEGFQCTQLCTENCPQGYECQGVVVGASPDVQFICIPTSNLCNPCSSDTQCNDGKCIEIGGGKYCTEDCSLNPCPDHFSCVEDEEGALYCLPNSGACDCNSSTEGDIRPCQVANDYGICSGFETCEPEFGWTNCDAPQAEEELCDGLDNDCDGIIDESVTQSCQTSNEFGTCEGQLICMGAEGSSACTAATPSPEVCNGLDDDCDGSVDENITCDDGNPCTEDSCNGWEGCVNASVEGLLCDYDGALSPCQTGKCSMGACMPANADGLACTTSSSQCPAGICSGGNCNVISGTACEVEGTICSSAIQGTCSVSGSCMPQQDGGCVCDSPCDGICVCCKIGGFLPVQVCVPFEQGEQATEGECTCVPGETEEETQSCGNCGVQERSRTCNSNCGWGDWSSWSACSNEGSCSPGATQSCGDTACQQRTCDNSCNWGSCGLKPGAACTWDSGANFQCCGSGKWQFCNQECQWFDCQTCEGCGCL